MSEERYAICPACKLVESDGVEKIICYDWEVHAFFESVCWREPPDDWPNIKPEFAEDS